MEHAPERRYLPLKLTATMMYEDFLAKHPGVCGREMYRKKIKEMNIGFAKFGHEECETCMEYEVHKKNEPHSEEDETEGCAVCIEWTKHIERAGVARSWYNVDKEQQRAGEEAICSVKMQKVMLSRMPGMKSCVFMRLLVELHMTFVPLGRFQGYW